MKRIYSPKGFMVGAYTLPPRTTFDRHQHNNEFVVFNLGGNYTLEFDDETVCALIKVHGSQLGVLQVEIAPGEYFEIPKGVPHTEITGDEPMKLGAATKELGIGLIFVIGTAIEDISSRFSNIFQK